MKLIIVSNRLPVTLEQVKQDEFKITQSSGGLISGLSAYLDSLKNTVFSEGPETEFVWVGWPGTFIPNNDLRKNFVSQLSSQKCHPVFIPKEAMDNFYLGFCNKTLWPLFHYFPSYTAYNEEFWNTYKKINEQFSESISEILQSDDQIWIHDYHLMLVPDLLRRKFKNIRIGFFLHIPFPQYEVFSLLPQSWRTEILEGILGSDLVGFHTQDYSQYFLRCILRILGLKNEYGRVRIGDRSVKVRTFPMGIDYHKFSNSVIREKHQSEKRKLQENLHYEKIILSIDRLDYTKGILNRLLAFEIFLDKNPDWKERISLLLHIIPSRIGVDQYETLKHKIDEQVGRINGKFSTLTWTPIAYRYGFLDFDCLTALYSTADIMLVTPLRDGMNLIAKEYLACRQDKTGVLILSEMAGASKELGEAIIINPNYKEEIAVAIERAIKMNMIEQVERNTKMQERLKKYDVNTWATNFIDAMAFTDTVSKTIKLDKKKILEINNHLLNCSRGILFLDYDGTLVPFKPLPEMSVPEESTLNILEGLSNIPNLDVVLISGRDKETLSKWFGKINNIFLSAEHGAWISINNQWQSFKKLTTSWKKYIYPIFELYVDRLPGSFVEEKEYSLVWHYRNSNHEMAVLRKRELLDHLLNYTAHKNLEILSGKKIIEVKNAGINKGLIALQFLSQKTYDFIIAFGDDQTDEYLFNSLPPEGYTIKVGKGITYANFRIPNIKETISILKDFLKLFPEESPLGKSDNNSNSLQAG